MRKRKHKPEKIVAKLRQADVLISQGPDIADVIRQIGVSEVHSSAMLDSPRRPCRTIRSDSSAEWRLRVARRMSFTIRSDEDSRRSDFCLISTL